MLLSTSLQTEVTGIDSNSIDNPRSKTLEISKTCNNIAIDPFTFNCSKYIQVDLNRHSESPFSKPKKSDFIGTKTPMFKVFQSNSPGHKKKRKVSKKNSEIRRISPTIEFFDTGFVEQCKNYLKNTENEVKSEKNFKEDDKYNESILSQLEQEQLLKLKLREINSQHERKVKTLEEHIQKLKKDNQRLCTLLDDKQALTEAKKFSNKSDTSTDKTIVSNRAYIALNQAYEDIKEENHKLVELSKNKLCVKCKAFTLTNSELSSKISRLKKYLDSE